ncbi:transporter substrate-binding domain-containing protein [Robbsia sp. KACC 23696]|uniref:transporter substrate-binding domain-containing protein n=1 Tax=Robbsia sp. KACC 23696 TaxID=3149231 RepID=UPI00325AE1B0
MAKLFAPTGRLRVSINIGNAVLANMDAATGEPTGVSVDLARAFAQRLGVPLQLVVVKGAAASVANVSTGKADIGFFAVDPKRGQDINFTKPYVLIQGNYLVREGSPITDNAQVDQAGIRVAVSRGSAYDLFLTRALHKASIVRLPISDAVPAFQQDGLDVVAGIKTVLETHAGQGSGLRLLPQPFMTIRQAMGVPKAKGADAAAFLSRFVEDEKTSGFVATSLSQHHISGATVAGAND